VAAFDRLYDQEKTPPVQAASPPTLPTKEELVALARERGFDPVGVARVADVDRLLAPERRLGRISAQLPTVVALGRPMFRGVSAARHPGTKQFTAGRLHKWLDEQIADLSQVLERRGVLAFPVSSLAIDFSAGGPLELTPAGQGSFALRQAAVVAGLGTLGLNEMLLTPRYAPRLYLGGLLTDVDLEPDQPLAQELCLGLEACGRCAAVCPEQAIPLSALHGAPLSSIRGLDSPACARSSQPMGVATFVRHLTSVAEAPNRLEQVQLVRNRLTGELWQEMAQLKEGAFTGCSACLDVCPVGEDYVRLQASPHRQDDLPNGVEHRLVGDTVQVTWVGPTVRRAVTT